MLFKGQYQKSSHIVRLRETELVYKERMMKSLYVYKVDVVLTFLLISFLSCCRFTSCLFQFQLFMDCCRFFFSVTFLKKIFFPITFTVIVLSPHQFFVVFLVFITLIFPLFRPSFPFPFPTDSLSLSLLRLKYYLIIMLEN